ncbi:MAG: DUF2391 domain-containing protein [Halococcoides sp.]
MSDDHRRPGTDRSRSDTSDRSAPDGADDRPDFADLYDELAALEDAVDDPEERERVREAMETAVEVQPRGQFGRVVRGFTTRDAAQSLMGAAVFGFPMFVEDGTRDVGRFLAGRPPLLALTAIAGLGLVVGILYVADIQEVRIHRPIAGVIPRKLLGVVAISLAVAVLGMVAWGRVDLDAPRVAAGQILTAWVPMGVGAALGDIVPG